MARCVSCDEYARKNKLPFPPPYDADEVDPDTKLCFSCWEDKQVADAKKLKEDTPPVGE